MACRAEAEARPQDVRGRQRRETPAGAGPGKIVVRRDRGLYGYERALRRAGFARVAGADEAGRGACAGPLVIAAVVLPDGRRGQIPGLADSKLLTALARERVYDEVRRRALDVSVVVVPPADVDAGGLHRCNIAGMRRALATLAGSPAYVLTDGFGVGGLGVPGLALWKGDQVAACVAAASVVAKVSRDRMMAELDERYPAYAFAAHKVYVTERHAQALAAFGPCPQHRRSFINVARAGDRRGGSGDLAVERLRENAAALTAEPVQEWARAG
jgi:ribonuclease HII